MKQPNNGKNGPTVSVITGGSSDLWILTSVLDTAVLTLSVGQSFVVLQQDNKPAIIPFEPGTYDVAAADFADGSFPVVIICIGEADKKSFQSIPVDCVNAFLSKLREAYRTGAQEFAGYEHYYMLDGKKTKFRIAAFPIVPPLVGVKDDESTRH